MVMGPDGASNQKRLCWRRPAVNYWSAKQHYVPDKITSNNTPPPPVSIQLSMMPSDATICAFNQLMIGYTLYISAIEPSSGVFAIIENVLKLPQFSISYTSNFRRIKQRFYNPYTVHNNVAFE
jgi:hypothetical protein